MAREKFERVKPHVNIGTIGHVDHGKTTLLPRGLLVGGLVPAGDDALALNPAKKRRTIQSVLR